MILPQRVHIVHKGALGDFLQAWPSMLALARHFDPQRLYWAGREAYSLWTSALGLKQAPPGLRSSLDGLYGASLLPRELNQDLVVWFGLRTPPTDHPLDNLWFIPGLDEDMSQPVREVYCEGLKWRGVSRAADWLEAWRQRCMLPACKPDPCARPQPVLLFPGAGHAKRCWPLEQFLRLAKWLRTCGERPVFVLGPAERERGLEVQNFEQLTPEGLAELQSIIQQSKLVIGNDSGPLHLAGYCRTPCLALFGPASPHQWGPFGARVIWLGLDCSPCSDIGKMACEHPECISGIGLSRVQQEVGSLLEG